MLLLSFWFNLKTPHLVVFLVLKEEESEKQRRMKDLGVCCWELETREGESEGVTRERSVTTGTGGNSDKAS